MKLSKITVYDYENKPVIVELPDKEIEEIFVQIISGDETGVVVFKDGTLVRFDACEGGRMVGYYACMT